MRIKGLYLKVANFICNGTAKMKLVILVFLYSGEFVKNPTGNNEDQSTTDAMTVIDADTDALC